MITVHGFAAGTCVNGDAAVHDALGIAGSQGAPRGSVGNLAAQLEGLGVAAEPLVHVGKDPKGTAVADEVLKRFPNAKVLFSLDRTLPDGDMNGQAVQIENTLLLTGDHPDNTTYLLQLLDAARGHTVLLLSDEQISQRKSAWDLIARVETVVVSYEQARMLSGKTDLVDGVRAMRDGGARNVLVMFDAGVLAFVEGDWLAVPAFVPEKPSRQRAGKAATDVCLATYLTYLTEGDSPRSALRKGQAAATLFLEGKAHMSREAIEHVAAAHPQQAWATPTQHITVGQLVAPLTAAGLLITLLVVLGILAA